MYKIYPKNYDPMIAAGPPGNDTLKMGITWTPDDTIKMLELEKLAYTIDYEPPKGFWHQKIQDEQNG